MIDLNVHVLLVKRQWHPQLSVLDQVVDVHNRPLLALQVLETEVD